MKNQLGSEDYRDTNRYDYHYDRKERLSKIPEELRDKISGSPARGLFRRNRTLSVILLDIVLIAVVWFIFLPLIRTGASGRIDGYAFALHSFSYGGDALVSLKVVKEKDTMGLATYDAAFALSSDDRTVEMQGALPEKLNESVILRTSLPLSGKATAVLCTVILDGKKLSLKAKLQRES